jgi:hypothetical protein
VGSYEPGRCRQSPRRAVRLNMLNRLNDLHHGEHAPGQKPQRELRREQLEAWPRLFCPCPNPNSFYSGAGKKRDVARSTDVNITTGHADGICRSGESGPSTTALDPGFDRLARRSSLALLQRFLLNDTAGLSGWIFIALPLMSDNIGAPPLRVAFFFGLSSLCASCHHAVEKEGTAVQAHSNGADG